MPLWVKEGGGQMLFLRWGGCCWMNCLFLPLSESSRVNSLWNRGDVVGLEDVMVA